jgi:hypothetical protein
MRQCRDRAHELLSADAGDEAHRLGFVISGAVRLLRENAMLKSMAAAAALIAGGLFATTAPAQTGAPATEGATGPRAESVVQGSSGEDRPAVVAPVLHVTSVEVMRSAHGTPLDIIRVRGTTSSGGWEEAELVPLTRGVPKDGILELVLVARAPGVAMEATGFEPIEAIFPIESSHPYKGINVHSASEAISLAQLPGYAELKSSSEDCSKCVGKTFVAKGAAAPAGKSAAELIKEDQLPALFRVIKHSDGIPSAESNPNRLTLVLSKDGTVAAAIWD